MFTIIAGVIGLGIAVALLIVGANYLGDAYTTATAKARATALANFGQQVQGAVQLAKVDGTTATSVSSLAPSYLSAAPTLSFATIVDNFVTEGDTTWVQATGVSAEICTQVAGSVGGGANVAAAADFDNSTAKFSCIGATAPFAFGYKVNK